MTLDDIRPCLEGVIPAMLATRGEDGLPNVTYLSQARYIDAAHLALSFQFFNKTRRNLQRYPDATLLLRDPHTCAFYRLHIRYLRTESEGAVFEALRAQLAGVATHTGMAGVFALRGADIYAVQSIEAVPGPALAPPPSRHGLLGVVRRSAERMAQCGSLEELIEAVLCTLRDDLGLPHVLLLLHDAPAQRLYTIASHGYAHAGTGSEIALGQGVIGMAAQARVPVRITHMTTAQRYSHAARQQLSAAQDVEIPFPGLPQPQSQVAVPIIAAGQLLGVLFAESTEDLRFSYEDEDVLAAIASQFGTAMQGVHQPETDAVPAAPPTPSPAAQSLLQVRYYRSNHSVFLNGDYLIKGAAGAIFWRLLQHYQHTGRTDFSNRELRLDTSLDLPGLIDNLEARLILLTRRLAEQPQPVRIEKTGRGRFRLAIAARVQASEEP